MTRSTCWICGASTRPFWSDAALEAVDCSACGHIQAGHRIAEALRSEDYHATYEQDDFVRSLGLTRRRQAARILDTLNAVAPLESLFDFGCGRGWLLAEAKTRGSPELAGGDVSDLALGLLDQQGIRGVKLDAEAPLAALRLDHLGFVPQVISFLDVIEHFDGNLTEKMLPWLERLPPAVRFLILKVPVREGLMFSMADLARRAGLPSLERQLFQVGSFPPHYQYYTRRSLSRLVANWGLDTVRVLDDLDFEPEELGARLSSMSIPRGAASLAGRLLAAVAGSLSSLDSRIVIAERRQR